MSLKQYSQFIVNSSDKIAPLDSDDSYNDLNFEPVASDVSSDEELLSNKQKRLKNYNRVPLGHKENNAGVRKGETRKVRG